MTRSASQRYTERHKEKDSPHTGRRARRRRRRRRLVRQKGQRVDDTLRALLLQFSPHHTQVVSSLRASSIPTKSAFVPVVTSPSITSRFFDRRRGERGSPGAQRRDFSRREGFQGRIFQTGSNRRRDRATGSRRRGMWIVTVSSLRYVCVRLRHLTLDFLGSGSFRPLLLFFPDDGERFPRRRVSRARPEDGTRGFEAPTRRKDRRRGERRGARFFVVARASSPRERAFTCVIGSDSEYAKRPREVPI